MALSDIVGKSAKKIFSSRPSYLGKALGYVVGAGAFLGAYGSARADVTIDTTWTYQEINNIMDGNPLTLGKGGVSDPVSGETIWFSPGTYQLPNQANASYTLKILGVHINSTNRYTTFIEPNPNVSSPIVFSILSPAKGNQVTNLTFRNSGFLNMFLDGDFDPDNPIIIQNCTFRNSYQGIDMTNKEVMGNNSLPSVKIDSCEFDVLQRGSIFDRLTGNSVNNQTAWAQHSNNYFNIDVIGSELPSFTSGGNKNSVNVGTVVVLGLNDNDGNTYTGNGVPLQPEAYSGVNGPNLNNVTASLQTNIPNANLEHEIGLNPNEEYPYIRSLQEQWGGDNLVENPNLNWAKRPLPGSPLRTIGKCKKLDGTERYYCGANPPFGDKDKDGLVTKEDYMEFKNAFTGSCSNPPCASLENRIAFDSEGDGDIDQIDEQVFLEGANFIPASSSWALTALGILTATAGTLVLGRKNPTGNR